MNGDYAWAVLMGLFISYVLFAVAVFLVGVVVA